MNENRSLFDISQTFTAYINP